MPPSAPPRAVRAVADGLLPRRRRRTALYNWIFARQHGGTFVLRIEDTDTERNRHEWIDGIQSALRWIGVEWDEGPYFQSQRTALYADAAARLYESGSAYYCDCTREVIDARTKGNERPGYDGFCRDRGLGPGEGRALRFRTPREGSTTVVDLIRGEPVFENALIEDFVVWCARTARRCSCSPTWSTTSTCASSHVIRGEEHLPNTPKAITALAGARRRRPARVRARAAAREREAPEAVEAPRPVALELLSRRGLPARGDAELPDAARVGAVGRPRDRAVRGARGAVAARGRALLACVLRREEARARSTASTSAPCRSTSSSTGASRGS